LLHFSAFCVSPKVAMSSSNEKVLQEAYEWQRSKNFPSYSPILGHYQAKTSIELAHGNSALDLPCGDGTLTKIFAQHFQRVVGLDVSPTHLAEARKRLPNVEFHESLIEEFVPKVKC